MRRQIARPGIIDAIEMRKGFDVVGSNGTYNPAEAVVIDNKEADQKLAATNFLAWPGQDLMAVAVYCQTVSFWSRLTNQT